MRPGQGKGCVVRKRVVVAVMVMIYAGIMAAISLPAARAGIDVSDALNTASEKLEKVDGMSSGIFWSFDDKKLKYPIMYKMLGFNKDKIVLNAGVVAEDNEAVLAISYKLAQLKEDWNCNIWILDLLEVDVSALIGWKEFLEENEPDHAIGGLNLKLKW